MKHIYTLFFIAIVSLTFAQEKNKEPEWPLNTKDFAKLMTNQFSYVIAGNQSPATGLKVETSKPSITLLGTLYKDKQNYKIVNIELTGGATNDLMNVFSQNQLNGYFRASIGCNWISNRNSGWVDNSQNVHVTTFQKMQIKKDSIAFSKKVDTAMIYLLLIDGAFTEKASIDSLSQCFAEEKGQAVSKSLIQYVGNLTKEIIKTKFPVQIKTSNASGTSVTDTSSEAYLKFFTKTWTEDMSDSLIPAKTSFLKNRGYYTTIKEKSVDSIQNLKIKTFKDLYTKMRIQWLNASPFISNTSFTHFDRSDSSLKSKNSLLYGLKFAWNSFFQNQKNKGKYRYFIYGASIRRVNTLDEIDKFSYKKSEQIKVNPRETLSNDKTGDAYEGKYSQGLGIDLSVESYITTFIRKSREVSGNEWYEKLPGLYGKIQYTRGFNWRDKDKLAAEGGFIFSITNSSKDSKNLLSIIPYAAFSNILKQHKPNNDAGLVSLHDRFSVGVRFGIPINIGK